MGSSKDFVVAISNEDPKLKLLVCLWPLLFPSTLFQGHPGHSLALGYLSFCVSCFRGTNIKELVNPLTTERKVTCPYYALVSSPMPSLLFLHFLAQ